ncbi:TonB family protein [Geothrix sp. PMB-07]|uniref:TonB family protein n=1 Tax=Geothrix sp. PMB-07 TaxID=3068640 RepID=UPI00274157B1|nr:TonB family protein [Geothrix sp. PMB-07]WLT32938.1 TonB family protein [Geothrix sp. PMB-07]
MGTYTRLGSYLLASELASDPFGAVHRAVIITGNSFDRHGLVRTFSEELFQAGLNTRLAEAGRVVPLLGGARIFGLGYRIEGGKTPHVAWDYVPGRSLAQLIDKARQEQIPFGVDHALTVIQGVAQGIVQMQAKGVSHGVLSPHSVWVSFEGATQIVDAPYAAIIKSLLAKAPAAKQKLAPYLQMPEASPVQQDLFALGAVLYELLTFERLPLGGDLEAVLDKATLKAAQEEAPLPAEIRAFLGRLLLSRQPFATMEAFNAELERVLYDGEYSPTTFNMAFFMHTLFREENDRDATAMKAEQGDNYIAYTAAGETLRSGATRVEHIDGHAESQASQKNSTLLIGGGLAAVVILGLGYMFFGRPKVDPAMQKQLAELQLLKVQIEQQKSDLDAKAKAEADKTALLQKQLAETKSVEEKVRIQKQLEEAQQRKLELERQQKQNEQRLAEQKQNEQRLAEQKKAAETKVVALPPPPAPEIPKPQPMQEAPKPAVPTPAPATQAAPTAAAAVLEPARMISQAPPAYPLRASQLRWEMNVDHFVRLKVFVGEQGQPLKVSVVEGVQGAYGFDEAAIDAANKSTFAPATRDGKPVRGWTPEITYKFQRRR